MKATLSAVRKNAGLTARQMADACGVGYNKIFDWEMGRKEIPEKYALIYCKLGGCNLRDLKDCKISYVRSA